MQKIIKLFKAIFTGDEKEFTTGSINKALFLLAIPMILEMLMESLFAVVDAYYVSKVGTDAVATIGLTESVITLIYSVAIGMSMAATAMVSRRIGEGKPRDAGVAAAQAMLLAGILSVSVGAIGVIFAPNILQMMGASESVVQEGVNYTRIMLGSNFVIIMLFLLNGVFRGAGDALMAMIALWISNIINIILDPLFIFGYGPIPEMGVTGAAVATTIGRSIGVIFQLAILFYGSQRIRVLIADFKLDPKVLKTLGRCSFNWSIAVYYCFCQLDILNADNCKIGK